MAQLCDAPLRVQKMLLSQRLRCKMAASLGNGKQAKQDSGQSVVREYADAREQEEMAA